MKGFWFGQFDREIIVSTALYHKGINAKPGDVFWRMAWVWCWIILGVSCVFPSEALPDIQVWWFLGGEKLGYGFLCARTKLETNCTLILGFLVSELMIQLLGKGAHWLESTFRQITFGPWSRQSLSFSWIKPTKEIGKRKLYNRYTIDKFWAFTVSNRSCFPELVT